MRSAKRRTPSDVDTVRFHISITEPDPLMRNRDHEPVNDYDKAVAALAKFVAHLQQVLDAARNPFAPGAAQLLEDHGAVAQDFANDSNASSVLWDAGRAIRVENAIRETGIDPRVEKYEQERARREEADRVTREVLGEPAPPIGMFDEIKIDDGTSSRFDLRPVAADDVVPQLTAAMLRSLAVLEEPRAQSPRRRRPKLRIVARAPLAAPDSASGDR